MNATTCQQNTEPERLSLLQGLLQFLWLTKTQSKYIRYADGVKARSEVLLFVPSEPWRTATNTKETALDYVSTFLLLERLSNRQQSVIADEQLSKEMDDHVKSSVK